MKPLSIIVMVALSRGVLTPLAAGAVTLHAEVPEPIVSVPAAVYEQTREDVYRVDTRLQGFAIDPAASSVRHVREAPRIILPDPPSPMADSITLHPLAGSLFATVTDHHWEEHQHFLRNGEVQGTLVRRVHAESTLVLDGQRTEGTPPGFMSVLYGDRYRGPRDPCSDLGPGKTASCSWTGTGPSTHYTALLNNDTLSVEGFVGITSFLSPQGAEYYTFDIQPTAVPAPAAAWLLPGALALLPWRRRPHSSSPAACEEPHPFSTPACGGAPILSPSPLLQGRPILSPPPLAGEAGRGKTAQDATIKAVSPPRPSPRGSEPPQWQKTKRRPNVNHHVMNPPPARGPPSSAPTRGNRARQKPRRRRCY